MNIVKLIAKNKEDEERVRTDIVEIKFAIKYLLAASAFIFCIVSWPKEAGTVLLILGVLAVTDR